MRQRKSDAFDGVDVRAAPLELDLDRAEKVHAARSPHRKAVAAIAAIIVDEREHLCLYRRVLKVIHFEPDASWQKPWPKEFTSG